MQESRGSEEVQVARKSRGLTLKDRVMGQVRGESPSHTDLRQMNHGVDSVHSQEGRKERRIDKTLNKMYKILLKS